MKLILSRKAFDSGSGGVPNPILPDGRMVPLPIPDKQSPVCYGDVRWDGLDVGAIVSELTKVRIPPTHFAHLDPDLNAGSLPRQESWRPLFGQEGPAQGHLRKNGVGVGDLFLFFGLFRPTEGAEGGLTYAPGSRARHMFWGWLQVGDVIAVDQCPPGELPWARYHPHFHHSHSPSNTLYVSSDQLELGGTASALPGAGYFREFRPELELTAATAGRPSIWDLPGWTRPTLGRPPLTFHADPARWAPHHARVRLSAVARGQEFVLDADDYPEARAWALSIIGTSA